MRVTSRFLGVALIVALMGCSSKKSSGGGGGGNDLPLTKDDALAKLTPAHAQNFENWKQKVVKSCDANEVFGIGNSNSGGEGIDPSVLLANNGGSLVFSDGPNIAVLDGYNTFPGVGEITAEESVSVNGRGYSISAKTKREGLRCSVFLFGQKVHEVALVQSFEIGAHWNTGKSPQVVSVSPNIYALGSAGTSEAIAPAFFSALSQTLKPSKDATAIFAKKLGVNEEQAASLFILGAVSNAFSVKIDTEPTALWSNQEGRNLIAHENVLKRIFDGSAHSIPVEVRLPVANFSFDGFAKNSDSGNLKLIVTVAVSKSEQKFAYATQSVVSQGVVPLDKNEAVECAKNRVIAYIGNSNSQNSVQPNVQVMFSPCRTLHNDVETASYENGMLKSLIPVVFAGVSPSSTFQYNGWDGVLAIVARNVFDQGKDLVAEIDPQSKTQIVPIIAAHFGYLKSEIDRSKNLALSKDAIFRMGLDWSFAGKVVSSARVGHILQAIDNAIDTFKVSSEKLLGALGKAPDFGDDQLSFALSLDEAYKAQAVAARNLSKEIGYSAFDNSVFDWILQEHPSLEELKNWATTFVGIKGEIEKYPGVAPVKSDLVSLSVKHLRAGTASLQDLSAVYAAVNNTAVPFEKSSEELVASLSESVASNKDAVEFAAGISPEYKQLAVAIRDGAKAVDFESWGNSFFASVLQKRPTIDQLRAWNETLTAAQAFTQREKGRTAGEFGSPNDSKLKSFVETAIKESWATSDFVRLENLAEFANLKSFCDRSKGASSAADCAGERLFSKSKGMFFDPAFGERYVTLAKSFAGNVSKLSGYEWNSLRGNLTNTFFGASAPVWSQCDNAAFDQKSATLNGQIAALLSTTDQMKKWDLERQIDKTLDDCR